MAKYTCYDIGKLLKGNISPDFTYRVLCSKLKENSIKSFKRFKYVTYFIPAIRKNNLRMVKLYRFLSSSVEFSMAVDLDGVPIWFVKNECLKGRTATNEDGKHYLLSSSVFFSHFGI